MPETRPLINGENIFNAYTHDETDSIYVGQKDRFVVSLIAGYNEFDSEVFTPKQAAKAALDLIREDGSSDTVWYVYDRQTRTMHRFEQDEFDPEWGADEEDEEEMIG